MMGGLLSGYAGDVYGGGKVLMVGVEVVVCVPNDQVFGV
jgi:hypothetical protein